MVPFLVILIIGVFIGAFGGMSLGTEMYLWKYCEGCVDDFIRERDTED